MMTKPTPNDTDAFTKNDWQALRGQLDSTRAWWRVRMALPETERALVCGAGWIADYGVLPCALSNGHDGPHRCYGSQGPIDFADVTSRYPRPATRPTDEPNAEFS